LHYLKKFVGRTKISCHLPQFLAQEFASYVSPGTQISVARVDYAPASKELQRRLKQDDYEVPVVDPVGASLKFAEALVSTLVTISGSDSILLEAKLVDGL
jgi:hypothetical protein